MKKSHKFDNLSSRECEFKSCHKRIKARLVEKEQTDGINKKFPLCFKHFKEIEFTRQSIGTKQ